MPILWKAKEPESPEIEKAKEPNTQKAKEPKDQKSQEPQESKTPRETRKSQSGIIPMQ